MIVCCDSAGGWISSNNERRLCCLKSLSIVLNGLGGSGGGSDRFFFNTLGVSGSSLLSCLERLASLASASGSFSSRYLRRFESFRGDRKSTRLNSSHGY